MHSFVAGVEDRFMSKGVNVVALLSIASEKKHRLGSTADPLPFTFGGDNPSSDSLDNNGLT